MPGSTAGKMPATTLNTYSPPGRGDNLSRPSGCPAGLDWPGGGRSFSLSPRERAGGRSEELWATTVPAIGNVILSEAMVVIGRTWVSINASPDTYLVTDP